MGLFNRLFTSKEELIYRDDKGNQHRLSSEQYGEICVIWGVKAEKWATMQLGLFGSVRMYPDIIAKIHKNPHIVNKYGTAFSVAAYCCYPVIRLGISNEFFKGAMQGVKNTILQGGQLFNGHPSNPSYYQNLVSEASQYTATFLEMAGMEFEENYDPMLLGVSGACAKLFIDLQKEYAGLQLEEFVPYISNGTFENPVIMESQKKDQESLIRYAFSDGVTKFIKATDESRNLILIK